MKRVAASVLYRMAVKALDRMQLVYLGNAAKDLGSNTSALHSFTEPLGVGRAADFVEDDTS